MFEHMLHTSYSMLLLIMQTHRVTMTLVLAQPLSLSRTCCSALSSSSRSSQHIILLVVELLRSAFQSLATFQSVAHSKIVVAMHRWATLTASVVQLARVNIILPFTLQILRDVLFYLAGFSALNECDN